MKTLLDYYQIFMQYSKINPLLATALGVYAGGMATWLLRDVPRRVWEFTVSQVTTTLRFHNRSEWGTSPHFYTFMEWYKQRPLAKLSRHMSLDDNTNADVVFRSPKNPGNTQDSFLLGMGYGTHFFLYRWRLFWVAKHRIDSNASTIEKQEFVITGLTRSRALLQSMVEEFAYKVPTARLKHCTWDGKGWNFASSIQRRPMDTVLMDEKLKGEIISHLEHFYGNRDWFIQRGLKYRKIFILHGKPGTGKTSFISALAAYFNCGVYSLNLAEQSDKGFATAVANVPSKSFLLIEDVDSAAAIRSRQSKSGDSSQTNVDLGKLLSTDFTGLTLSGVLNTLDGISSLDNVVIFLTTNCLETLDSALLRKGRINHIYEIPYLKDSEIKKGIKLYFPEAEIDDNLKFPDIPGCNLEGFFLDAHGDYDKFITLLLDETFDHDAAALEQYLANLAARKNATPEETLVDTEDCYSFAEGEIVKVTNAA